MLDLKAVAQQFHNEGFAIVRQLYSQDEIASLEQQLQDFIQNKVPLLQPGQVYFEESPSAPIKALHHIEAYSDYFRQIMGDPRILEVVQTIFPEGEIIQEAVMFFAKMGGAGSVTPPHQDNVFQHWAPPDALTATLAVDESTVANGPLICLKGSHKLGVLPHRQSGVLGFSRTLVQPVDTQVYPEVALCMKPGDMALHHVNTVHRSDRNTTPNHRRQLGIGYRSSQARRDEESYQRYLRDLENLHAGSVKANEDMELNS